MSDIKVGDVLEITKQGYFGAPNEVRAHEAVTRTTKTLVITEHFRFTWSRGELVQFTGEGAWKRVAWWATKVPE